jgi:hypothetical protein
MMLKKINVANDLSRKNLADPNLGMSYHDRLIKSKAIDLRDNSRQINYGNGYSKIEPISRYKIFK